MVTLRANKFRFEKTSNGTKVNGEFEMISEVASPLINMSLCLQIFLLYFQMGG